MFSSRSLVFSGARGPSSPSSPLKKCTVDVMCLHNWIQGKSLHVHVQWVKKLSQCLALLKRLTCRKSSKLCNNVKIIYVILYHLSSYINPRSCDLKQN